jgi:hypothetical protein
MNEQALSQELHRVADAAPVPADLFPTGLLARPVTRTRRSGWTIAAAVAAVLLLFALTPPGRGLVSAAGELIMRVTVRRYKPDPTDMSAKPLTWPKEIGHSTDRTLNGVKEVMTRLHIRDWPAEWPLPTYNPPDEAAQVYRTQRLRAETGELLWTSMRVHWVAAADTKKTLQLSVSRWYGPVSRKQPAEIPFMVEKGIKVETVTVKVKGQPATAVHIGESWSIHWGNQTNSGSLSGNVGLEELLKVAESMPDLK